MSEINLPGVKSSKFIHKEGEQKDGEEENDEEEVEEVK